MIHNITSVGSKHKGAAERMTNRAAYVAMGLIAAMAVAVVLLSGCQGEPTTVTPDYVPVPTSAAFVPDGDDAVVGALPEWCHLTADVQTCPGDAGYVPRTEDEWAMHVEAGGVTEHDDWNSTDVPEFPNG